MKQKWTYLLLLLLSGLLLMASSCEPSPTEVVIIPPPPPPAPPECTVTEAPERTCSDGVDNDCDGLTDAADPDCSSGTTCQPPNSNNASVNARPPGRCPTRGPCIASFSVSTSESINRIAWIFPGATQSESDIATGTVIYPGPGLWPWSNKICTSFAAEDPTDACCRPANGAVSFEEDIAAPVAGFGVSVDGLTATVTDGSSGVIDQYILSFGDDFTTSQRGTVAHTYAAAGTFTLTQQVFGPGGQDVFSLSVTVE